MKLIEQVSISWVIKLTMEMAFLNAIWKAFEEQSKKIDINIFDLEYLYRLAYEITKSLERLKLLIS